MDDSSQTPLPDEPMLQVPKELPYTPNSRPHIFLIAAVGLIMLGVGLGAGYFLFANKSQSKQVSNSAHQVTQTSPTLVPASPIIDEKANWKTYKSDFSFKYPSDWVIDHPNLEEGIISFFEIGKPQIYPSQSNGGNAKMTLEINKHDADSLWKNLHNTTQYPEYSIYQETTIAGKRAMIKPGEIIIWYGINNEIEMKLNSDDQFLQKISLTLNFDK